jgi:hypothetical protein
MILLFITPLLPYIIDIIIDIDYVIIDYAIIDTLFSLRLRLCHYYDIDADILMPLLILPLMPFH